MITSPYNCICIIFSTERIKSLPFSRADQKLFSYWQSSCVNHMSSDTINTHSRTTTWLSFQTGNLKNAFHSILAMIKKKIWYLCNHTHCILLLVLRKGELSFWLHLILQWESPLPQSIVYWMIDYLKKFPGYIWYFNENPIFHNQLYIEWLIIWSSFHTLSSGPMYSKSCFCSTPPVLLVPGRVGCDQSVVQAMVLCLARECWVGQCGRQC